MKAVRNILVATAALALSNIAGAQQFTMKISSPTINEVAHEWMKAVKSGVEQRSGGKIRVELYPANQLGQLPATIEGVALGTIEMTLPAVGFLAGLEPRFQVLDAPGLFDSMEHAGRVFADPQVRSRLATFGAAKGIEPLLTFINGPLTLLSAKPVQRVADFKGLKLRAPGGAPIQTEPLKRLGASPLSLGLGEVLPALQNRSIDGGVSAIAISTTFKFYDVVKAQTVLPGSFLVATGIVNRGWMKSLGPDLERIVREESRKHEVLFTTWGIEDVGRVEQTWTKHGGQLIRMAPAEADRFLKESVAAAAPILNANPQMKEDYQAFLAAAKKHRR